MLNVVLDVRSPSRGRAIWPVHDAPPSAWKIRSYLRPPRPDVPSTAHVDLHRFNRFTHALLARGVYLSPVPALHSVLSTAHTENHVSRVVAAAGDALSDPTV